MTTDIINHIDKNKLIHNLITGFFEEVLLIDCKTEKVINVLEIVFGREKKKRKYDGESYDIQIVKTLRDTLIETERNAIEQATLLSTVKAELEEKDSYTVSFTITSNKNEDISCKEFVYRYLNNERNFILLQCSDVTDVVFNDLDIESRELLSSFRSAIDNDQFEIWFQPQFDFKENRMIGAEALVRWNHPEKGLIYPSKFVPLFENVGCVGILDEYVVIKVCRYMAKWRDELLNGIIIPISVNLSRNDIFFNGLCKEMLDITVENNIPTSAIHIEITESACIQSSKQLIDVVDQLRKAGFKIEMDDFDSGYSSLNSLKDINIDKLKLDMRFLSSSLNSDKSKIILSSVINMAKQLGISVIAEGVETLEQAETLWNFGCDQMQGYYFSKPMPVNMFEDFIKKHL